MPSISVIWPGSYSVDKKFICAPQLRKIEPQLESLALSLFNNETLFNLTSNEAELILNYVLLKDDVSAVLQFLFLVEHTSSGSGVFTLLAFFIAALGCFGYPIVSRLGCSDDSGRRTSMQLAIEQLMRQNEEMERELEQLQAASRNPEPPEETNPDTEDPEPSQPQNP